MRGDNLTHRNPLAGAPGLVGDIGGTNCRFARATAGSPDLVSIVSRANADFAGPREAIQAYLAANPAQGRPQWAVLAAAGPVRANAVDLTNNTPWRIDGAALARELGIAEVRICNDLAAVAAAVPSLTEADLAPVGAPQALKQELPIGVVGVGTGLGVSGVVFAETEMVILAGEGGHTTFAPTDPLQRAIADRLAPQFGRLSNERVLSGDGLHLLYGALAEIEGARAAAASARAVSEAAIGGDPLARRALAIFSEALGAFCGDLALTLGAGGLCLSGGMLKNMQDVFDAGAFRQGFEAKGRFADDLHAVPTWHVRHPQPALLGAAMMAARLTNLPNVLRR
ncbi:MAG: glucokinase [Hyphomonadaceae bacterium]|nr:glucokinase [Hyphomonadaceae bacterium]